MRDDPTNTFIPYHHIKRQLLLLGTLLTASFIICSILFWLFEYQAPTISHFGDAAWWWFVTSSTVGYGDIVPQTLAGRAAGVIAIIIGLFGYTHIIGIILQVVQQELEREERGLGAVEHTGHVAICEYTAFADELIREIKAKNLFSDCELVLIGSLVERTPYHEYDFIYGVPISPQVQERANISEAAVIFVFANIRFSDPDTKTLHIVSRIMERNQHAPIYVELEDEQHPLLEELPRSVHVLNSSDLLHSALRHEYLNISDQLAD